MKVSLPNRAEPLWLCVFDSLQHKQPLVVLTNQPSKTPEQTVRALTRYFARWAIEDMHRWAKQEFSLEKVRLGLGNDSVRLRLTARRAQPLRVRFATLHATRSGVAPTAKRGCARLAVGNA